MRQNHQTDFQVRQHHKRSDQPALAASEGTNRLQGAVAHLQINYRLGAILLGRIVKSKNLSTRNTFVDGHSTTGATSYETEDSRRQGI